MLSVQFPISNNSSSIAIAIILTRLYFGNMEFSEWLRGARKRSPERLTQVELARRSGLSQQTISSLERGQAGMPQLDTAAKLFIALGEVFLPPIIVISIKSGKQSTSQPQAQAVSAAEKEK